MLSNGRFEWLQLVAALALSLMLAGCTGLAGSKTDSKQVLAARAEARWAALIDGDFGKAYGYESPAYRAVTPLRLFSSRFGSALRWDKAEVIEVLPDAEGETAVVRVMISYTTMDPAGGVIEGQRPVDERWVRTGGEWWHTNLN